MKKIFCFWMNRGKNLQQWKIYGFIVKSFNSAQIETLWIKIEQVEDESVNGLQRMWEMMRQRP